MTAPSQIEPVVDRLQSALDAKLFPSEWQQWGSRLLDHLRKPVQVAVMGLPGSGKSTLINMMMGQSLIPRDRDFPVVELAHGTSERSVLELEDGTCLRRNGGLTQGDPVDGVVRARLELPEDALLNKKVVEVGLDGGFGHQMSMVNWVVQWADIVLWCTQEFSETEAKLWSGVPDDVKDHSFLVLTMADRQMLRGVLQDRIDAIEPVVTEEFLGLYPIATEQAITARAAGTSVNEALWQSSGGQRLVEGVMSQVMSGRTADMDQAQMLLNRFAEKLDVPAATVTAPAQAQAPETVPDRPAEIKAAEPKGAEKTFAEVLDMLQDCANEMLQKIDRDGKASSEDILARCAGIAGSISGLVQDVDPEDIVMQELQADAQEGEEMMMLLQLERDEDAAVDAVTLLLQMKKEISDRVAPIR